jgi:hypothetical protein
MPQIELFHDDLRQWRLALGQVKTEGAVLLENFIPEGLRVQLQAELEAGPFEELPQDWRHVHDVHQDFDRYALSYPMPGFPITAWIGRQLQTAVRQAWPEHVLLSNWRPNDIAVQRYREDQGGIETHRDFKRDILMVAVLSVAGRARFQVTAGKSPQAGIIQDWMVWPRSLVLLRAPGFTGTTDDRPYHVVHPPIGDRISVAFRMNVETL